MEMIDLYLVAHITAVALWIGAGFVTSLLGLRLGAARDADRRLAFARDAEWLGPRVLFPASMAALVSGVLLVHEVGLGYGSLWIRLGLAAVLLSTALGLGVFAPGWKRVGAIAAERGIESPEALARMGVLLLFSWVDLGLLFGALFVMTVKPTGGDTGALVATALIVVLSAGVGVVARRRVGTPVAAATSDRLAETSRAAGA